MIHVYSSVKLGWGALNVEVEENFNPDTNIDDNIFVVTPELGLEVNVFRFFRIAFTGGYRWVDGVNPQDFYSSKDYNSITGAITFRLGGFGNYRNWSRGSDD